MKTDWFFERNGDLEGGVEREPTNTITQTHKHTNTPINGLGGWWWWGGGGGGLFGGLGGGGGWGREGEREGGSELIAYELHPGR